MNKLSLVKIKGTFSNSLSIEMDQMVIVSVAKTTTMKNEKNKNQKSINFCNEIPTLLFWLMVVM